MDSSLLRELLELVALQVQDVNLDAAMSVRMALVQVWLAVRTIVALFENGVKPHH